MLGHPVLKIFHFQGLASQPPKDLNSLLVEIRVPEDIETSPWAKQFREYLSTLNQPEKEAMFDFVLVCNVLRIKESEVKQLSRGMKWRLTELNKDLPDQDLLPNLQPTLNTSFFLFCHNLIYTLLFLCPFY